MARPNIITGDSSKRIEKHQTFFQHKRGFSPILLEVLDLEQRIGNKDICKVRWHIIGKDRISTSVFMMAAKDGIFADFVPVPRVAYQQAVRILNNLKKEVKEQESKQNAPLAQDEKLRVHRNAKRRVLRLIDKYLGKR